MKNNTVNQETIARMLGLSRSTVTKVLNHDPVYRVSAETRELVLRTAAELGFQLRRRRTGNIGFIVCGEVHSAMHETHQAVCEEAGKLGYRVFFVNKPPEPTYRDISLSVNPLAADGAVLIGDVSPEVALELSRVMPTVVVDPYTTIPGVDNVCADHQLLSRRLNELVISCGHTTYAIIVDTLRGQHNPQTLEGCRAAMKSAGIPFDRSLVWEKSGKLYPKLLQEVLSHPAAPTAILAFTTSDHPVILSTLFALGRMVPETLSYAGWSTSYFSSLAAFPKVTCLDSYHQVMAKTAVHRLMERIEARNLPVEDIVIDVEIERGQTVGEGDAMRNDGVSGGR
jgi:LacI family transcriptional regulator